MFPFSALDSETSTESKDRDEHVLDSELPERSPSGRTPLNDVVNSETAHLVESSHRVREGQQKQKPRHHTRFDAFVKPEHQPFQTSWSTVFYTPNSQEDSSLAQPTKRGCYVCRFSPTGSIAALAINKREAANTAVVFFSSLVSTGLSSPLYPTKMKDKSGRYSALYYRL